MKLYSPNSEERAFLYQEVSHLEPLIKHLGSLSVVVEDGGTDGFRVTFVVAPESVGLKIQATGPDLFEAAIAAKDEAARQLNQVVNALSPEELPVFSIPRELLH